MRSWSMQASRRPQHRRDEDVSAGAKCLRCGADSSWIEGRAPVQEKPKRTDPLAALQELVRHGTEHRGEAVVLMYDHEDGFFISTVDTGCHHYPVKEVDSEKTHRTLEAAIVAAVKWHNKQGEKRYMSHLKRIPAPSAARAPKEEKP